jgi:hypothetical protein
MRSHRLDSNKHAGTRTSGNSTAAIRARVEQALRELPLAGHDRERVGAQLLRHALLLQLGAGPNPDAEFFGFRDRVVAVVEHFTAQGLTLEGYLKAIVERPSLLTRKPATVIAHVEAVAAHFRPHGLTLRRYLGMALQQPQLFYQSPATLIARFETVGRHFAPHGLTLKDYLRAAEQRPTLFTQGPATIQSNIETVAKHFAPHGLELAAYLRAAASQPSLFYQKPSTLIGNIEAVARHFAANGVTLRRYLATALRQPQLFYQSPSTLIANVETVVGHFAPHGLTLPHYLAAALREPGLFTSKPATIQWKIEAVADYFAPHGLTVPAYLRAAIRNPRLFSQAPTTIQANIETVASHFTAHGLGLNAYLQAALRQPQLFSQSPATIRSNIENVAAHFADGGLSLGDYLAAALRQPQLFARAPTSMIRHIGCVIDMQAQGLVTFPGQGNAPAAQRLYPLFAYLVRNPLCMTLSDDNYALRMTYAQITGRRPSGTVLLRRTRHGIEQDLAAARSRNLRLGSRQKMKRSAATARKPQAGFSLIFMSIFITAAMMVFVAFLPGREAGDINIKTSNNVHKLERVEQAMRGFMAMYGRRPCPADGQYAENTTNFGLEAATPGTCTGGAPSAPMGPDAATGFVVGGVIPTRSLGLPDDYQFDDFGRRITYVVDKRATQNASCIALETLNSSYVPTAKGGVYIYNASPANGGTQIDQTMYAYIIHGASGYGAFPAQGASTPAGRINSGSTDGDMQTNAGVDAFFPGTSTFTYNTTNFTDAKVKKSPIAPTAADSGFDDLVWYRPDIKNYCCLGAKCANSIGFRIDGAVVPGGDSFEFAPPMGIKHGDINGDGIQDLVIAAPTSAGGGVYVIFGKAGGGVANPLNVSTLKGNSTGFHLYDSHDTSYANNFYNGLNQGKFVVADINGDGYDDIVMCGSNTKCVVYYGHAMPFTDTVNINNTFTTCQTTWFQDGNGLQFGDALAITDVNGDGYKDLIVGDEGATICLAQTLNGNFTFAGTQQTDGKTIKLGSPSTQTWTFKTTCTGGNVPNSNCVSHSQTAIQGTAAQTLTQLAADLAASVNSKITPATYSADATHLYVAYNAPNCTTYSLNAGTGASGVSAATLTPTAVAGKTPVFVIFGRPNNLTCGAGMPVDPITPGLDLTTLTKTTTPKGTMIYGSFGQGYGMYLTTGNINGDADPVTGKPLNDIIATNATTGGAYIIAGQTGTWPTNINADALTGIPNFNTTNPVCSATAGPGNTDNTATCGTTLNNTGDCDAGLSAGDVTGDGIADILFAWEDCNNGLTGNILVKGGAGAFTSASYTISPKNTAGTMLNLGTAYNYSVIFGIWIGGSEYETGIGQQIGDINGDSVSDVFFPAAGASTYGSVYALFGGANLIKGTNVNLYTSPPNGTNGVRIDCPYADNNDGINSSTKVSCGFSLDEVDLNGDGIPDIVIGVPGGSPASCAGCGYVYVLYGKTSGWTSTYDLSTIY